jgi:hypothetical protein
VTAPAPDAIPELPSSRRLLRSTAIAVFVATAILITIVLPAEYGVDPTGIGRLLGLKQMGEVKMALAREEAGHDADAASAGAPAAPTPTATPAAPTAPAAKSDVVDVVLAPTQGKEIKLAMLKDAMVTYSWATNRGVVNYDTHADAPTIKYHGYAKGAGVAADSGVVTAAFDGMHGWYWRNRGRDTVVVTLRMTGDYSELKRLP